MRIVSVEAVPITVGLAKPVVMAQITVERSHNVLAKITADNGLVGWGEGVEAVNLTGDTQGAIASAIDFLGPRLVGEDPLRRTALWWAMRGMIQANDTAIGAIDMALHDLAGKHFGVPVVELLGGRVRGSVPALTIFGSGDPDADVAAARTKHESGFRWFKLKLGLGPVDAELETMRRVREALPADCVLSGDANQGWSEPEAVRFLRALDGLDVRFIEQPIAQGDHAAMVRVARASPVPICVDESIHSHNDILGFGRTGVAGVSLKLIKLGGITGVMRGAALCESLGLEVNLAGKIAESSVAAAANVHCAAALRNLGFGCSPGNQGASSDVASAPLVAQDGRYQVPSGPGLGIEVDQV